ncbi:MAG: LysR family transcriptional regulator [Lentisphaeria bacterium]|nr:LysR family transcriptional regulator [Lentisphaeria bacterium]
MELTHLRYFLTVAELLHFRKAAEKLNMTQAPLSFAIKKLEEELETKLFERTSRSVKLTKEGEFFRNEAKSILARANEAVFRLKKLRAETSSHISIGYNEPSLNTFLPAFLANCRKVTKLFFPRMQELETTQQLSLLRSGELDIGFMRPYGFDLSGLKSRLVFREKYVLVMPHTHKLAKKEKITKEELSGDNIILFAREVSPVLYDRLTSSLATDSLPPPLFRQDARNKSSMLALVEAGFGSALLPDSTLKEEHNPFLIKKELCFPLPSVDILAVWDEKNPSGLLPKLLKLLPEG